MSPIKHKGQVVERVIRQSGLSLTDVARRLGISRNTLYNKFGNPNLSFDFIKRVGQIVNHDFTVDFPEMKPEPRRGDDVEPGSYIPSREAEYARFMEKYVTLSNKYCRLLELLVRFVNDNEHVSIKKAIARFMEESKPTLPKDEAEEGSLSSKSGYTAREKL